MRPFENMSELLRRAGTVWDVLGEADWLEAFAAHPRIGDAESIKGRFDSTRDWATQEQKSVQEISEKGREEFLGLNELYEERFGFRFIIFATGRSANEMLDVLKRRIDSRREEELVTAAA